jgi:hypothetical protein
MILEDRDTGPNTVWKTEKYLFCMKTFIIIGTICQGVRIVVSRQHFVADEVSASSQVGACYFPEGYLFCRIEK